MANMEEPVYVSIAEAAERIGCTNETVVNLMKRGALRGNDAADMRRAYVDRESLNIFCTAIPDYKSQLKEIKELKKELREAREGAETGIILTQFQSWRDTYDINKRFFQAMASVCLQQQEAAMLCQALNGRSYSKLSEDFDVPKTRCRQIIEKSLRKLRRVPSYETLCGLLESYRILISMKNSRLLEENSNDDSYKYTPIPFEQFSSHTQSVLKLLEIYTISDLMANPKRDLLKVRPLGRKSLNEIDTFMQTFGSEIYTNWSK